MKCFNCGYEMNDLHAENCKICGVKFDHYCEVCSKPNPKLAKFCLHCGHELKTVLENSQLAEARRQVAVIFADISGFTALSEKMDPEEVRDVINGAFQYILKPLYQLGGTVDKYIGDCVMVLFGAKKSHKDDSARAVKCALEMKKRIAEYSKERLVGTDIELKLSIGVNFGLVVTGQVGNYYDKDYTVIGDVVNTAQRLQVSAPAGEIFVSDSVFYDTSDIVDYSEPVMLELKNKEKMERAFSPISMKTIIENKMLVERQLEMKLIDEVMLSENRFVNITGDSGLGKTTLVREFLNNVDEQIKKIWINTNTNVKNRPFGLISQMIMEILNINSEDSTRIKENRLRSYLDYILGEFSEIDIVRNYNFLSLISGLTLDQEFSLIVNSMEYSDLKDEIERQIELFFSKLAKKQSLVFVIENADYVDLESLNSINHLDLSNQALFAISNLEVPSLSNAKTIKLKHLELNETKLLIESHFNNEVANETTELIQELSKGNPMIIMELIRTAERRQLIIRDEVFSLDETASKSLPTSLSGLILNKIDVLDDDSKSFLDTASTIGNEFTLEWLENLVGFDNEMIEELTNLSLIEFRRVTSYNQVEGKVYGFTQNVIREVIYNNMLKKKKKEEHLNIANYIDANVSSNEYELLAHHYKMAGKDKLAANNYYKYAVHLQESFNYSKAIEYYSKVYETKGHEYSFDSMKRSIELGLTLSEFELVIKLIENVQGISFSEELGHEISFLKARLHKEKTEFDKSLEVINELEGELPKNSNLMGRILQLKANVYLLTGNTEVIEVAKQSEEILSKSRDYESLADTMSYAGISSFMRGNLDDAILYLTKGYDYASLSNNKTSISKIAINLGIIYHASGDTNKSFTYLQEAIEAASIVGSIKNQVSASINLGVFYMEKGRFLKSKPLFEDSLMKATESGLIYQKCISYINLADLFVELGEFTKAMTLYEESLVVSKEYSLLYEEGVSNLSIAKLKLMNEVDASVNLSSAFDIFTKTDELVNLSDYYRVIAENEVEDVNDSIEKAIKFSKDAKSELKELQALVIKGIKLKDKESFILAKELARKIESDYEYAKALYEEEVALSSGNYQELTELLSKFDGCILTNKINNLNRN